MTIIYENQEEYEKAEKKDILKADVVAVVNGEEYDIMKSRYTRCLLGMGDYYLADLIRKTVRINEQ